MLDISGTLVATYYYDAFGNILEKTGTADNSILYGGYQYDEETGLYYLNARMYDPITARFLQKDTYKGQYNDPLSLNLYTYCHNEPLMYSDPTGHFLMFGMLDQQLKQLKKTADWFLNDTKIGQSINKNVVTPVKDLVNKSYKTSKKKAPVAVGIFDGLREESQNFYSLAVSMDPMSRVTKLAEAASDPKGTVAKAKSTATAVKNIIQDPIRAVTEAWNNVKADVVGYVNGDVLYGDTYTQSKFATHAAVFVGSLFAGSGELKTAKAAVDGIPAAGKIVSSGKVVNAFGAIEKAAISQADDLAVGVSDVLTDVGKGAIKTELSLKGTNYSAEYVQKLNNTYKLFQENGYEIGEHGLNRIFGRINQGNIQSVEQVLDTLKTGVKYVDTIEKV